MFRNLILRFAKDFMVATTLNFTPCITFIIIVFFSGLISPPPQFLIFSSLWKPSLSWNGRDGFAYKWLLMRVVFNVRQQFWLQRRNETSEICSLVSPTIRSDHSKTDACQEGGFWNVRLFGETLKHLLDCTACHFWFQRAALVSRTAFTYPGILPVVQ